MNNEIIKTVNELVKILDQCLLGDEITLSINRMKQLLDYITNLQQENQDIKDTLQDKLDYIGHLKELCDKYEEEHNTKFNEWVFDKRENERLKEIIKDNTILVKDENGNYQECNINPLDYKSRNEKAREYIEERKNLNWYADGVFVYELLNILNGDDK